MTHRPDKPEQVFASRFDNIPPKLASEMTAKDYVEALKESRWNCDFETQVFKVFLQTDSIDDIVYSDHTCSNATALVVRFVLPDFIESKGLKIDRIVAVENDGEYSCTYSNIEISATETVSRLVYGSYFVSNETSKYIINVEERYPDGYKFRIASKNDSSPNSHKLMEELLNYAKEHNFLKGQKIDPNCNFIKFDRKYNWDDLILSDAIKTDIRKNLQNLIEFREVYQKNGLQVKRGLVLSGEPGTGKTQLAKVLCNQVSWSVVWVSPKHLETAKKVSQIVQLCKEISPTILFLEDIDLYGGSRESNHNPALLGEMMNQLDGVQENTDIITIATTNNKEVLEKALVSRPGRFDKVIDFPLPSYKERLQMLKTFSVGLLGNDDSFLTQVAKECEDKMTGAQIRELVNMAVIHAIDQKAYNEEKKLFVTESHFRQATKTLKSKDFSKAPGFNPVGTSSLLDSLNLDD